MSGEVVDEQDLPDEVGWRAVEYAVHGAQQGAPRLVVKYNDDTRVGQRAVIVSLTRTPDMLRTQCHTRYTFSHACDTLRHACDRLNTCSRYGIGIVECM